MKLTHFHPKSTQNFGKKATALSTSDLSPKHQTSEIFLKTSNLTVKHLKWKHWLLQSSQQLPNMSGDLNTQCFSQQIWMMFDRANVLCEEKQQPAEVAFEQFRLSYLRRLFPRFNSAAVVSDKGSTTSLSEKRVTYQINVQWREQRKIAEQS